MGKFGACFALVICFGFFSGSDQSVPIFWRRRPTLPSDRNDPFYKTFQIIPTANETAKKLMNNFLQTTSFTLAKRGEPSIEDIVVLMDGSGSIGRCEFKKGKSALTNLMELKENTIKWAEVTFASTAKVNFKFTISSLAANEMKKITYPGGGTNTQAGLSEAKNLFQDNRSGRRVFSRKMVFLVTDGQSNDRTSTIRAAQALKSMGIEIFVVAVGSHIYGIDEMVKVASNPSNNLFRVKNLAGFFHVVKLVMKKVSPNKYQQVQGQYDPPC